MCSFSLFGTYSAVVERFLGCFPGICEIGRLPLHFFLRSDIVGHSCPISFFLFFFGFKVGKGLQTVQRSQNCNRNACPTSGNFFLFVSDVRKIVPKCLKKKLLLH